MIWHVVWHVTFFHSVLSHRQVSCQQWTRMLQTYLLPLLVKDHVKKYKNRLGAAELKDTQVLHHLDFDPCEVDDRWSLQYALSTMSAINLGFNCGIEVIDLCEDGGGNQEVISCTRRLGHRSQKSSEESAWDWTAVVLCKIMEHAIYLYSHHGI